MIMAVFCDESFWWMGGDHQGSGVRRDCPRQTLEHFWRVWGHGVTMQGMHLGTFLIVRRGRLGEVSV